jgi:hypothetical protein
MCRNSRPGNQRGSGAFDALRSAVSVTRRRDSFLRPTSGSNPEIAAEQVLGDYQFPLVTFEGRSIDDSSTQGWLGRHVLAVKTQVSWAGDNAPVRTLLPAVSEVARFLVSRCRLSSAFNALSLVV